MPKLSWLLFTVQLGSRCDFTDTTVMYGAGFLEQTPKQSNQAPNYISKIKFKKIIRCNPDVNVIKLNSKNKINGCNHLRADGNSRHLKPPGHLSPLSTAGDASLFQKWFRRGPLRAAHAMPSSTEGISDKKTSEVPQKLPIRRGVSHPFALFSKGIEQVSLRYPF